MPKTASEDDKKQGDKLQSLMERMASTSSPGKRGEGAENDAPPPSQDDDDEDEVDEDDGDDADDIQPDDVEDSGAMGR